MFNSIDNKLFRNYRCFLKLDFFFYCKIWNAWR